MGDRSYEGIDETDLSRLAEFARQHRDRWFKYEKPTNVFEYRFLCSALCQGAALHYVDGRNGVKDFDIYEFYADVDGGTIPYRAHWCYDFGPSKFGHQSNSKLHPEYEGRRIDLFVRALPVEPDADPVEAVRTYLETGKTSTAHHLRQKAVVLVEPDYLLGRVVWPNN